MTRCLTKNFTKQVKAFSFLLVALAAGLSGCTKPKQLKDMTNPDAFIRKADLVGKTGTYTRAVQDADPNNTIEAIPGFHYDMGLVQVQITEAMLNFVAVVPPAPNSSSMPNNTPATATIVAQYPITSHFDRVYDQNDYGETTNHVIEQQLRPWDQREYMRVDWGHPSNSPAKVTNQLFSYGSISEDSVSMIQDATIDVDGTLSFVTDSNVTSLGDMTGFDWSPSTPSYRVKLATYFIPRGQTTNDFAARNYTDTEFQKFGLFRTYENFLDPEHGALDTTVQQYANLFNLCEGGTKNSCSTNQLVYHPSADFPSQFIAVTQQTIAAWNTAFQTALGRSDNVITFDPTPVTLGDARFNTIGYVDQPSKGGLLGVSQTVVDNVTGQTYAARATIYGDGIRYEQGYVDDMLDDIKASGASFCNVTPSSLPMAGVLTEDPLNGPSVLAHFNRTREVLGLSNTIVPSTATTASVHTQSVTPTGTQDPGLAAIAIQQSIASSASQAMSNRVTLVKNHPEYFKPADLDRLGGHIPGLTGLEPDDGLGGLGVYLLGNSSIASNVGGSSQVYQALRAKRAYDAKMAALGMEGTELVEPAVERYIQVFAQKNPGLCSNPDNFRAQLKDNVAQLVFYTTLLHEMGHNFGLRHNFAGSADRNYYQPGYYQLQKQIAATADPTQKHLLQLDAEGFTYSSVMDYSAGFYNGASGLGQYDLAAIHYAYTKNMAKDDPVLSQNFMFCTDHQIFQTPTCRQFDSGGTVWEITKNTIDRYQRGYVRGHFRNGRADYDTMFGSVLNRMFMYTMIPTRLVLDHMIYQLLTSPPAVQSNMGDCSLKFMKDSVDKGEITNVCSGTASEADNVNPNDWGTFYNGLFVQSGPQKGQFKVDPTTFIQTGFADLVYASQLSTDFFTKVLGAPEAGRYYLETVNSQQVLTKIDDTGTDQDAVTALASNRGQPVTSYSVNNVVNLGQSYAQTPLGAVYDPGLIGKVYYTTVDPTAGFNKVANVGYFWDKYIGMIVMGARDLGVENYSLKNMVGNAYFWPQSQAITTALTDHMVNSNPQIAAFQITTNGNTQVSAIAPASMDINTQAYGTITGLADFATYNEQAFVDKMRVCNGDEAHCQSSTSLPTVEFTSAGSNDVFKAIQTPGGDSISYKMVQAGKAIADLRAHAQVVANVGSNLNTTAQQQMTAAETQRAALDSLLKADTTTASWVKDLTDLSGGGIGQGPSAFYAANQATQNYAKIGPYTMNDTWAYVLIRFLYYNDQLNQLIGDAGTTIPIDDSVESVYQNIANGTYKPTTPAATPTPTPAAGGAALASVWGSSAQSNPLSQFDGIFRASIHPLQLPTMMRVAAAAPPADLASLKNIRTALVALAAAVEPAMDINLGTKIAPDTITQQTSSLANAEGNLRFINSIMGQLYQN